MSLSKEKRTKEQVMQLLDRAIEQEEVLLEKIKSLETGLAECRKKVENPRHELDEQATPGSKISFRLDFYRTQEKGPLKGIIEHLPTRESQTFNGTDVEKIYDFLVPYIGGLESSKSVTAQSKSSKTRTNFPPEILENMAEPEKRAYSPLLRKLFPEIFSAPASEPPKPMIQASKPVAVRLEAEPFTISTTEHQHHNRALRRNQSFYIEIPMQELKPFEGTLCAVKIVAESTEKKNGQSVETTEYCTPGSETMRIPVLALSLEQGIYRLVVSITSREEPQKAYYREARLLLVQ